MFINSTNHQDGSFVRMSSAILKAKCESAQNRIAAGRLRRKQEAIEEYRQEMMSGFWHRLFKRPTPTDEEVIEWANKEWSGIMPSQIWWADHYAWGTMETIERLLNACRHADDVNVSTRDLEMLG